MIGLEFGIVRVSVKAEALFCWTEVGGVAFDFAQAERRLGFCPFPTAFSLSAVEGHG